MELLDPKFISGYFIPKGIRHSKGWLYIGVCEVFDKYFKIGRTNNLESRLNAYNDDRPYPTFSILAVSALFFDVNHAESRLLKVMQECEHQVLRREWYPRAALGIALDVIQQMEIEEDTLIFPDYHILSNPPTITIRQLLKADPIYKHKRKVKLLTRPQFGVVNNAWAGLE